MRWLLLAVLALQTATCGQQGPLTLPEQEDGRTSGSSAVAMRTER